MKTDQLLSEDQIAQRLGMSTSWLRKARVSGGGPRFVKIGKRVFYRDADVEAFISDRVRKSTSDTGPNQRAA